jgi:hypothetical protein
MGRQMNCWFETGFGELAMMACFDNSLPRGSGEVPILWPACTSGNFF